MKDYSHDIKIIKENLSRIRDIEIRRKTGLMLKIMTSKNIRFGCCQYGICYKTFYGWLKKFRSANYDLSAVKNKPRGCRLSPKRIDQKTVKQACKLRKEAGDVGGLFVAVLLKEKTGKVVAHSTLDNIFSRERVTTSYRCKKRNLHTKRYASEKPLDRVQMDTVGLKIEDTNGNKVFAVTGIDCHSRFAFAHCCLEKSTEEAKIGLSKLLDSFGKPRLVQTDNGVEFTYLFVSRLNAKRAKSERYAPFEKMLAEKKIEHYLIKPRTPQLNGKVERFHRSLLRYVRSQNLEGKSIDVIKRSVARFLKIYNENKPHASLKGLTPGEAFNKFHPRKVA